MAQNAHVVHRSVIWSITPVNPLSDRYTFAHSSSLLRMPDGRLLAAWWAIHLRGGCVLGAFSPDDGRTWTDAEALSDVPDIRHANEAFLRDDDRVWLFYGLWFGEYTIPALGIKITPIDGTEGSQDCYYRYTDDSGRTWSQSRLLDRGSALRANGIRLSGGQLLLPAYDRHASWVIKSKDRGGTWGRRGYIRDDSTNLHEPCVLELEDGRVLMLMRAYDGHVWKAVSKDAGDTWSAPEPTQLVQSGHPAELFRLKDGTIVLGYDASLERTRHGRTVLGLRFSTDEADTWSEPCVVEEQPEPLPTSVSIGYPSVAEAHDGSIVVTYYHKVQPTPGEPNTTQIKAAKVARTDTHV